MAEDNKNLPVQQAEEGKKPKTKAVEKKPNIFVRAWKRIAKFFKDVCGEMKKVVWTSKEDLRKHTKLVIATIVAVALAIAVVDTFFSWLINSIAGLIG